MIDADAVAEQVIAVEQRRVDGQKGFPLRSALTIRASGAVAG